MRQEAEKESSLSHKQERQEGAHEAQDRLLMNPQLDLFSTRSYQNELFGAEYITVRAYNPLDNGPIDFIVKESKKYFDLSASVLSLKLKVVNADGSAIATVEDGKDNVALVNNAMHSVFSDAQVIINGKHVEGSSTACIHIGPILLTSSSS